MFKVGIIGATGYVGVELIRLLLNHKGVILEAISSTSFVGKEIDEVYGNFSGVTNLICKDESEVINKCDIIFGAVPHGLSEELAEKILINNKVFIDMGADFRLKNEGAYKQWYKGQFNKKSLHEKAVYGLPELYRNNIKESNLIANPGCYPTSIALGLAPILEKQLGDISTIIIDSKSGVTGAGRNLSLTSHYVECNESFNAYGVGGIHRHVPEIEQVLGEVSGQDIKVTFTPHLLPINRGILSTIYINLSEDISLEEIWEEYNQYYKNEKFVKVLPIGQVAKIKNVTYSNFCHISIHKDERCNRLIVCSTIDNMVKGAAGQGIQNMNLILGLQEDMALEAVPPAF